MREGGPPLNGRPLDRKYVDDQVAIADGVLDGTLVGEPYRTVGRNVVWAGVDSARATYTPANLYPGGIFGGNGVPGIYHAITIPGTYRTTAATDDAYAVIDNIKTGFYADPRSRQHVDVLDQGLDQGAARRAPAAGRPASPPTPSDWRATSRWR